MTLVIHWEGWFEIRTSTDPDPTDEPRGVSGYTFAIPGEPDLDRVVRFQGPQAQRVPGPRIGVTVSAVEVDGQLVQDHPLVGMPVDLLEDPREEQRNNALDPADGYMFIDPFHVQIRSRDGSFVLQRRDDIVPGKPGSTFRDATYDQLRRRGFKQMAGELPDMPDGTPQFYDITGFADPGAYRLHRRGLIEARLNDLLRKQAQGQAPPEARREIAGLRFRLDQMLNPNAADRPTVRLTAYWARSFRVNGATTYVDPGKLLGSPPETREEWPVAFWFGVFDCDANAAYTRGSLTVPQKVPFG